MAALFTIIFIILMVLKLTVHIPLVSFIIFGIGLAGFVFAVIALRKKDRAVFTYVSIIVGIVIIVWLILELAFPH